MTYLAYERTGMRDNRSSELLARLEEAEHERDAATRAREEHEAERRDRARDSTCLSASSRPDERNKLNGSCRV